MVSRAENQDALWQQVGSDLCLLEAQLPYIPSETRRAHIQNVLKVKVEGQVIGSTVC